APKEAKTLYGNKLRARPRAEPTHRFFRIKRPSIRPRAGSGCFFMSNGLYTNTDFMNLIANKPYRTVATVLAAGLLAGCASTGVKNPSGVPVTEMRPDERGFVAGTG